MSFGDLPISRESLKNDYGSLEETVRRIRAHRPLDLNAERWRAAHPDGSFLQWRHRARACLLEGLHYDPGPVDLQRHCPLPFSDMFAAPIPHYS